ncbi:MAG: Tricarboxylate transport protein TctC [Betaproteobacteria bacterium]|nr:Tricarboxylate transport protein TctC [Betaproteobacteria bacterium]
MTNAKRSALLPELPTVSESGVPGFESEGWHGLFAPARTLKPIVDRLYREFAAVLRAPDTAAYLLSAGAEPVGLPPDQAGMKLRNEIARWAKVVKAANMKVD